MNSSRRMSSGGRLVTWSSGLNIYKVNKLRSTDTSTTPTPRLDPLEFLVSRNLLHVAENIFEYVGMEDTSSSCILVSKSWWHFLSSHIMCRWADKLLTLDPGLARLLTRADNDDVLAKIHSDDNEERKALVTARRLCMRSGRLRDVWAHGEPKTKRLLCQSFVLSLCCHDNEVICGLNSGSLQLWTIEGKAQRLVKEQEVHAKGIKCLARGGSGRWLVSGSYDCTAKIWTWDTWTLLHTINVHSDSVWDLSFRKHTLATAGLDGLVGIFSIVGDQPDDDDRHQTIGVNLLCLIQTGIQDIVSGVDLCESTLATAHEDSRISLWSLNLSSLDSNFELQRELRGHGGGVTAVRLLPTRNCLLLISASYDGSVRLWNAESGQCTLTLSQPSNFVRCLAIHNEIVVAGDFGGNTHIWNVDMDHMEVRYHRCLLAHKGHVVSVHLDAAKLITGSRDKSVLVQDFLALLQPRRAPLAPLHGVRALLGEGATHYRESSRERRRYEQRRQAMRADNRGWRSPFWRY